MEVVTRVVLEKLQQKHRSLWNCVINPWAFQTAMSIYLPMISQNFSPGAKLTNEGFVPAPVRLLEKVTLIGPKVSLSRSGISLSANDPGRSQHFVVLNWDQTCNQGFRRSGGSQDYLAAGRGNCFGGRL